MGSGWVNYWFIALVVVLLLSIISFIVLLACWNSVSAETDLWTITPAGKTLLRARNVFAAACGIIFAALFGVGEFDASDRSAFDRWCDAHPHSVPAVMVISAGLFFASACLAFQSKGDGRRLLMVCALVVAALSFLGAVLLMSA